MSQRGNVVRHRVPIIGLLQIKNPKSAASHWWTYPSGDTSRSRKKVASGSNCQQLPDAEEKTYDAVDVFYDATALLMKNQ
jgi:hypothetical protein